MKDHVKVKMHWENSLHHRAVNGERLVVSFGGQEVVAWPGQLNPHRQRQLTAEEQKDESHRHQFPF